MRMVSVRLNEGLECVSKDPERQVDGYAPSKARYERMVPDDQADALEAPEDAVQRPSGLLHAPGRVSNWPDRQVEAYEHRSLQ